MWARSQDSLKIHRWSPNLNWPVSSEGGENGNENGLPLRIENEFDVGVVASFGVLLPQQLIESFSHHMINMHPSLLPKYRSVLRRLPSLLSDRVEARPPSPTHF